MNQYQGWRPVGRPTPPGVAAAEKLAATLLGLFILCCIASLIAAVGQAVMPEDPDANSCVMYDARTTRDPDGMCRMHPDGDPAKPFSPERESSIPDS